MPVAHVYGNGKFQEALPLGAKYYPQFVERLGEIAQEVADAQR